MKSRSSTGVGQKIDLEYNIDTMRITDEGGDEGGYNKPQSSIMESIKAKSQVKAADAETNSNAPWERATGTAAWEPAASTKGRYSDDAPKISADVQSTKLKQMLGKIKSG